MNGAAVRTVSWVACPDCEWGSDAENMARGDGPR